jgi:hypothetical protein
MLTRLGDAAAGLARASKRQVHRASRKVERRRLEAKVRSEMAGLGQDLYDRLETGALEVDVPGVAERVAEITRLRAEIKAAGREDELATRVRHSIAKVDENATAEASADQTDLDAADRKAGSPAEQGGEG